MNRLAIWGVLTALLFGAAGISRSQQGVQLTPLFDPEKKKWGFQGTDGKMKIKPTFDHAKPFSLDGLAVVKLDGKYHFLDAEGTNAFEESFDFADSFREGVARVQKDGKFALIDAHGNALTKFAYDDLGNLRDGLVRARKGGKYGFIDRTGKWIIEPQFEAVGEFYGGLAWIRKEQNFGYIGLDGKVRIEPTFEAADNFSHGLAAVRVNGKYGYVDVKGKLVIEPQFAACRPFQSMGGRVGAAVRIDQKWGVINGNGYVIVEPTYEDAGPGLALRSGDKTTTFRYVGRPAKGKGGGKDRLVSEQTEEGLLPVTFKSMPDGASVYVVEEFDAYNVPPELLVRPEYLVGTTEYPAKLNRNKAYAIVFALSQNGVQQVKKLPCVPAANPEVKAVFP